MKKEYLNWIGTCLSAILTATQLDKIFSIVSLIFTILCGLTTIGYNVYLIVLKVKQSEKISQEDVNKVVECVSEETNKIKDEVKKL